MLGNYIQCLSFGLKIAELDFISMFCPQTEQMVVPLSCQVFALK